MKKISSYYYPIEEQVFWFNMIKWPKPKQPEHNCCYFLNILCECVSCFGIRDEILDPNLTRLKYLLFKYTKNFLKLIRKIKKQISYTHALMVVLLIVILFIYILWKMCKKCFRNRRSNNNNDDDDDRPRGRRFPHTFRRDEDSDEFSYTPIENSRDDTRKDLENLTDSIFKNQSILIEEFSTDDEKFKSLQAQKNEIVNPEDKNKVKNSKISQHFKEKILKSQKVLEEEKSDNECFEQPTFCLSNDEFENRNEHTTELIPRRSRIGFNTEKLENRNEHTTELKRRRSTIGFSTNESENRNEHRTELVRKRSVIEFNLKMKRENLKEFESYEKIEIEKISSNLTLKNSEDKNEKLSDIRKSIEIYRSRQFCLNSPPRPPFRNSLIRNWDDSNKKAVSKLNMSESIPLDLGNIQVSVEISDNKKY